MIFNHFKSSRDKMTAMALVINGELVEDSVLAREAENLRQRFQEVPEEQRQGIGLGPGDLEQRAIEWARENVIEQTLIKQEALKDDSPIDEQLRTKAFDKIIKDYGGEEKFKETGLKEEDLLASITTNLKVDRYVTMITANTKQPRTKDLAEYYRKNKDIYRTEEMVRAAHIVKHVEKDITEEQARKEAAGLYEQLQNGRSFEEIADELSDCPGSGGDLGYFPRGKMVNEFEDVVFNLEVGETSQVFKTVFGFHIAKLLDRRPKGLKAFSDVKDEIEQILVKRNQVKFLEDHVDHLRAAAEIEDRVLKKKDVAQPSEEPDKQL